jgi:hypothetical protein
MGHVIRRQTSKLKLLYNRVGPSLRQSARGLLPVRNSGFIFLRLMTTFRGPHTRAMSNNLFNLIPAL